MGFNSGFKGLKDWIRVLTEFIWPGIEVRGRLL